MANKVFISFRFSDGNDYKESLERTFERLDYIINKSENVDRSGASEQVIRNYLYEKLRDTSLTLVILTPDAINYRRNHYGYIDDWLYDELRYSLEDRSGNKTNGAIALYVPESKEFLISSETKELILLSNFDNLARKNMLNIKEEYKYCQIPTQYNSAKDTYISLVEFDKFINDPKSYIDSAIEKRERLEQFKLTKRM